MTDPVLFKILKDNRGMSLLMVLVASGIIVASLAGVGVSSVHMNRAIRATELTNLAVAVESNLINAFNNKINYPDPPTGGTLNADLRAGTLDVLPLQTSTMGVINVPIQDTGLDPGVTGFLTRALTPCTAFSADCVINYEIRLKRTLSCGPPTCPVGKEIYSYAFSYTVGMNPDLAPMSNLGNISAFDTPIDPGNFRVEYTLAKCDPANDLFMTGANRDTGEAFCVEKPLVNKCPPGRIPKGLNYVTYVNQDKSGTIELDCTANPMRTFSCEDNYSLFKFDPKYTDPEATGFTGVPGMCVFRTKTVATAPGTFPPTVTPYMSKVEGTFCPPFYEVLGTGGCHIIPDSARNATVGKGYCAMSVGYKNCTRTAQTQTWQDNTAAWNAWNTTCLANMAAVPPIPCTTAPANPILVTTCGGFTETSSTCNGVPDVDMGCASKGPWSTGTAYAYNFQTISPTAAPKATVVGRTLKCEIDDTSAPCPSAPATDINGNPWPSPKKDPVWYGGVQVSGVQCNLTATETKPAL